MSMFSGVARSGYAGRQIVRRLFALAELLVLPATRRVRSLAWIPICAYYGLTEARAGNTLPTNVVVVGVEGKGVHLGEAAWAIGARR